MVNGTRDYSNWENFVGNLVNGYKSRNYTVEWDIWNEWDNMDLFWKGTGSDAYRYEVWVRAFRKIRQLDPSGIIVGPSWSWGVQPRIDNPNHRRFTRGDRTFRYARTRCRQKERHRLRSVWRRGNFWDRDRALYRHERHERCYCQWKDASQGGKDHRNHSNRRVHS